jgi:hypothetical protein
MSIAFLLVGLLLVAAAYSRASTIPSDAVQDFRALVRESGGSRTDAPGFPDAYKLMSAQRRMLQNFYIGGCGLVFLAAGSFGLVNSDLSPQRRDTL